MPSATAYLTHLRELLAEEYEYERNEFRQQTQLMPLGRKIKRGICWYPLALGRSRYN